jgi:caffeoyl-CoA O-methyltransferase
MVESVARVVTDQPARYIKQIVSHLGHKLTTELSDDGTGVVVFETGRCTMTAETGVLLLSASAVDAEALNRVRDVLARHLERFGGREGLRVEWSGPFA